MGFKPEVVSALMNLVSCTSWSLASVRVQESAAGAVLLLAVGVAVLLQVPDWVDAHEQPHSPASLSSECRGFCSA